MVWPTNSGVMVERRLQVWIGLLAAAATLRLALAATVGVIDRVHRHAAHARTTAEPAVAAGLAERAVGVVAVGNLADRGAAVLVHETGLTRREPELGEAVLHRDE